MKRSLFFLGTAWLLAACVLRGESVTADTWTYQTFRIPPGDLSYLPGMQERMPELPDASASPEKMIEHVRSVTGVFLKFFETSGITLPQGTAFLVDPASGTLAVRTTSGQMDVVSSWAYDVIGSVPLVLPITVDIMQVDGVTGREVLRETAAQGDHTPAWKRMEKLADEGKAQRLQTLRLSTRSGQRVNAHSGSERNVAKGFTIDDKGAVNLIREKQPAGTNFEVEPVIGPDGKSLALNLALEHHFAPPEERSMFAGQTSEWDAIEMPATDFHNAKITTAISMIDGQRQLIGAWRPSGTETLERSDILQLAFVRADCVRNLPAENVSLQKRLEAVADKALPIPAPGKEKGFTVPQRMELRRFKVPHDFLASGGGGELPDDPLAPPDPFRRDDKHQRQRLTAKSILESAGIQFPEGASARFDASSSTLIVINTVESLDAVEAFVNSFLDGRRPTVLIHSLEIIKADPDLIRQTAAETAATADHAEVLHKLEALHGKGKVEIVSSLRIPTRSGQRATAEAGLDRMEMDTFSRDEKGCLQATTNRQTAGIRLEVDPTVGPDGWTIDVSVGLEYHYAKPSLPDPRKAREEKKLVVASPATKFHSVNSISAITLSKGMTRLIGTWQLEDSGKMLAAFLRVDYVQVEP